VTWSSWSKSNFIYACVCDDIIDEIKFGLITLLLHPHYRVRDQHAKSRSLLQQIVGHPCKWHPSFTKDWLLQLIIILCSMKQPIQNFLGYIYIYIWIYFTIIYRNYFFFLTATMRLQLLLIWQNKPWIFFFFEKLITRNTSFSTIPHQIWRKNVHFQWSSQIKIINEIDCSLKVYISVLLRTICPFFSYYIYHDIPSRIIIMISFDGLKLLQID
jgi:hypothetical protein